MGLILIKYFNLGIFVVLTLLYFYQLLYVVVALVGERQKEHFDKDAKKQHRFAFIVAARNESSVIANLIQSIKQQNYSSELIDIYVIADNCTDNTAEISRESGAIVYERFNNILVGKGYALDYAFEHIGRDCGDVEVYDGYFIFDADNVVDKNYVYEMNKVFDSGFRVITSYRNSKNYDTNWITAGYSLWFLREAKFLNNPRMMLNTSCAVSGTGFLISSQIVKKNNGWKFQLLTEDIQFSVVNAIEGERIGYCEKAILYDEQPCTFAQSWSQRMRWAKGFYQVMFKYGKTLFTTMFKRKERFVSCYDMLMTIAPATILTLVCIGVNSLFLLYGLNNPKLFRYLVPVIMKAILFSAINGYGLMFVLGLITTITEWKRIQCSPIKKILYIFSFPIFIFTYVPISIIALFKKVEWKPIAHSVVKTAEDMQRS